MTQNDLTFLPLRVTHVGAGGKRSFDPVDKRRLIEACLQPGASLSGLALKAGPTPTSCANGFACTNVQMQP
jgi:transposase